MGNYRFRLSDMMPNAWFYKLKDMSKRRKSNSVKKPSFSQQRQSHCFATESSRAGSVYSRRISDAIFMEVPLSSSRTREKRKTIYKPSTVSAGFSSPVSDGPDPLFSPNHLFFSSTGSSAGSFDEQASWSSSCNCRISASTADIIIDMNNVSLGRGNEKAEGNCVISGMGLPPILTKPVKPNDDAIEGEKEKHNISSSKFEERPTKVKEEDRTSPFSRKSSANFTGIRLRANSPKLAGKKVLQTRARKSAVSIASSKTKNRSLGLSESCAVVKSSANPQRDFRESMVEMIIENNIRATKDLEDLLACYLSLNSDEYHHIIVKTFEQIWFDMAYFQIQEC